MLKIVKKQYNYNKKNLFQLNTDMQINNLDKTNFTGYKSIVAGQINNGIERFSYITAKLDNNNQKDLDNLLKLKKEFPFLFKQTQNDIVSIFCHEKINEPRPNFIIDENYVFNSQDLKQGLADGTLDLNTENFSTKIFTLLGSLTKRISQDGFLTNNSPERNVIFECMTALSQRIKPNSYEDICRFFTSTFKGNIDGKEIATNMNHAINKAFGDYYL